MALPEQKTMDKKTHRIISLFFVILLLLTGLYADTIPKEPLSVYDLTENTATSLAPLRSAINDATICPKELPNLHDIEPQSRARFQERYKEIYEFLYLQRFGFHSLSQGKSCICHAAAFLFYPTQKEFITEYMYHSDGKKRI